MFGPRDALFLPAGWMFYEKAQRDCVGIKGAMLGLADLQALHNIGRYLRTMSQESAPSAQVVDCLTLAEPEI